tara:strand:- start:429 stop:704 length:276 start_codon:yes stop_codon:yes gene_type:complete
LFALIKNAYNSKKYRQKLRRNKLEYWKSALIRGLRSAVQTFLAVMMANQAGMFETDVLMAGAMAGATALVSVIQNAMEDAPFKFMSNIPKG